MKIIDRMGVISLGVIALHIRKGFFLRRFIELE